MVTMSMNVGLLVTLCFHVRFIRSYSISGQFSGRSMTPPSITYRRTCGNSREERSGQFVPGHISASTKSVSCNIYIYTLHNNVALLIKLLKDILTKGTSLMKLLKCILTKSILLIKYKNTYIYYI